MKYIVKKVIAAASIILLMTSCNMTLEENSSTDDSQKNNTEINYEIFKGLPKSENILNTVNCKDFRPSLLCYGDGNTFFMWNGTVYRHDGEITEQLFERNAYNLSYDDGKLYFIENVGYNVGGKNYVHIEGILYCYDFNKEVFEALTDYPVSMPIVNNGKIFFTDYATADNPNPPTGICRLNGNGTFERLYDGMNYIEYSGYSLKYDWTKEEKLYFSNKDKNLLLKDVHPYWACLVDDYYYYCSQIDGTLNRLSLITGEIKTLKPYESHYTDLSSENEEEFICLDYTVLNKNIYFIDDCSTLRKYDEKSDDYIQIDCEYAFRYLYADNKSIYGVGFERDEESINHTYHFIKLTIEGDIAECEILA